MKPFDFSVKKRELINSFKLILNVFTTKYAALNKLIPFYILLRYFLFIRVW